MARTPRIGITTRSDEREYQDHWVRNYWWAVLWAGGEPVMITPESAAAPAEELIARLDGLFLPGGGDMHPSHYGQSLNGSEQHGIHEARDELELSLTRAALAADLPILGVCRGIQVLNVAAGGSLLQHVEGHRPPRGQALYHDVEVLPDTLLAQVLGLSGRFCTNSYHHQAVSRETLAPDFRPAALTCEGPLLLEGIEGVRWRWVLGVQWHPERFYELDERHRRLFVAFVKAAQAKG